MATSIKGRNQQACCGSLVSCIPMATQTQTTVHLRGFISVLPDGTFVRTQPPVSIPADPSFVQGVATKDIDLDSAKSLWVRLFLPEAAQTWGVKLPIILYFHGGGFVRLSAGDPLYDAYGRRLALATNAIVISVNYRLAPEHRLPAAFDDAFKALQWLQSVASSSEEPWLRLYADYSSCFLMGHSAGGAIVHQLAVHVCEEDMAPLKVAGGILSVPFFGGVERTPSEIELGGEGAELSLQETDIFWLFSLPEGCNRDHPYSKVLSSEAPQLVKDKAPPLLVLVAELDLLRDRQIEYAKTLKSAGISVSLDVLEGGDHGIFLKKVADLELDSVRRFMDEHKEKLKN